MADYNYTTADDMASSGADGNLWTNIDGTPLLKEGTYPGKKHGFWKNVARVASFGGYNPDDRVASDVNKSILKQHGLNKESRDQVVQQHNDEIEKKTNDITGWDPNISRPDARKMAIEMFVAQYIAELEQAKANAEQDRVRGEEMKGRKPGSEEFGRTAVGADSATNRARGAQMQNVERGAQVAGQLKVPESMAQNQSGRAVLENMQLQDKQSEVTDARLRNIQLKPLQDRESIARAAMGANQAEARSGQWADPTTASRLAQFELNKGLTSEISPWTTAATPFPKLWDNPIEGEKKPVGSTVTGYNTNETIIRDAAGNIIGRNKTRVAEHPGAMPTTADPMVPAPPMTPPSTNPVGGGKQSLRLTPEQFQQLLNPR